MECWHWLRGSADGFLAAVDEKIEEVIVMAYFAADRLVLDALAIVHFDGDGVWGQPMQDHMLHV